MLLKLAPPLSLSYVAIQQSGSSYPLSLLKRASSGVACMLSPYFETSCIVLLTRCRIFVPFQLIGWSFVHPPWSSHQGKGPPPHREAVEHSLYEVLCTCGKMYIRETKRRLGTRLKGHKDACAKCLTDKSGPVSQDTLSPQTFIPPDILS